MQAKGASKESDLELPFLSQEDLKEPSSKAKPSFSDHFKSESASTKYIQSMPFIKLVTFFDTFLFARKINRKADPIKQEDLPLPLWFCNVEEKISALGSRWTMEKTKPKPSIILAILKAFKKECFLIMLLCFLFININIFSSLLAGSIINTVTIYNSNDSLDLSSTLLSVLILAVATLLGVFLETWYWHLTSVNAMRIRNAIIGFAYTKLQGVALTALHEINIGKVINLLSNDISELDEGLMCVVPAILSPYIIGLGGFFLWDFFEYSTIFGLIALALVLAFSKHIAGKTRSIRMEKNALTDDRIKLTNELIEGIRLIKMYAWEKAFQHIIQKLRENEVKKIIKLEVLNALGGSFSFVSTQMALVIMCTVYTLSGGILSPEKIYTSLMILSFVRLWGMTFFHFGIMFIASSKVMKTRVEEVLSIKEASDFDEMLKKNAPEHEEAESYQNPLLSEIKSNSQESVVFQNYTASWTKEGSNPCLNNINVTLNPGQITTIIGTIGSGKTSFLLSFLKEIPSVKGDLLFQGKVAYVEQEPIIFSGTVRSNILFGLDYEDGLYKKVIAACNLDEDFSQLDNGDKTLVGERGITLSGGQKARVNLARALYSRSDIYLFDDPLSAVDSRVGRHIFHNAIKSDLLREKIVVLVTHHLTYAKEADRVLLFESGRIIGDGAFENLQSLDNNLLSLFKELEGEKTSSTGEQVAVKEEKESVPQSKEAEERKKEDQEGDLPVSWTTYVNYIKQANSRPLLIGLILIYFASAIFTISFTAFMGYWGQSQSIYYFNLNPDSELDFKEGPFNNTFFVLISISFILLLISIELTKRISTYKFVLKANSNLHENMLKSLIRATVSFFDTTPLGTILNRFSNDIGVLDGGNTPLICDVCHGAIHMSWMMITLTAISVFLLIPCLIIFYSLYRLKKFFKKPVMETKQLDLASRGPLYSEISSTINGLLAIRVYRQANNFVKKFYNLLTTNSWTFLYMERSMRFFSLTLFVMLNLLSIMGTFILVIVAWYSNLQAGFFGLVIVMLQEIAVMGSWVVRLSLMMDINMQSVERILAYHALPAEPPEHTLTEHLECSVYSGATWPPNGQIQFKNVSLRYRPDLEQVLQGLTFTISGGCKVGVVGRTGAGKSSIIQALFRMVDLEKMRGSFITIDGADINKIGLNLLRKNIAIIPQNPVIFTGNIRRNLDPFSEFPDSKLWEALEEVNLKTFVSSLEKKLDTDMTLSNSIFSAGQKQLVCLARAILRKTKILVLDEATANVDIETDDFIQKKIMERFRDCTVITIAHRLITIANYDKVLVMDKGKAVEYDSPYMLLVEKEGDKEISKNDSIFADMVKKSGESMSKKIFEIASDKYFRDKKN